MDDPQVQRALYGEQFNPSITGTGSVLVLGNHNSGTSMLTRMLMLLGLYQGRLKALFLSSRNKLKYWELKSVSNYQDRFLGPISNTSDGNQAYCFQDVNLTRASDTALHTLDCDIQHTIQDLTLHSPWVAKDPRFIYTSHWWIPKACPSMVLSV